MLLSFLLTAMTAACTSVTPKQVAPVASDKVATRTPDEQSCEDGDGPACLRAGREIMKTAPSVAGKRGSRAFMYYERACRRKIWEACGEYGSLQITGDELVPRDLEAGEATLRAACDHGSPVGCANLGWYLREKTPAPPAEELTALATRTIELADKGCAANEAWSCRVLGMAFAYAIFPAETQDLPRAEPYLDKSCKGGQLDACMHLARVIGSRTTPPPDMVEARALLRRACDGGHGGACGYLGSVQYQGQGGPVDEGAALASFERGCQLDDADACMAAGGMRSTGPVMSQRDDKKALVWLSHACDLGKADACDATGKVLLHGADLGPAVLEQAAQAFRRGCAGDDFAACSDLGVMYGRGQGVPQDLSRARELFQKACDGGAQSGCDNLKLF
jgi:TPR repeat protein